MLKVELVALLLTLARASSCTYEAVDVCIVLPECSCNNFLSLIPILHVCSCENYSVIPVIFSHRLKNKNFGVKCSIPVEFQMSFQ